MPATVGIAGLTGKFAQCIIKALQKYPNVAIRGYCRNPHKLPPSILESPTIETIQGEFDDRSKIREFVHGTDVVVCCYFGGPDLMLQGQKALVDMCEEEGVPRYIPSDFAVDYTKIPAGALFPKECAMAIMEYLKPRRVEGVHILTGALMETFWSEFFGLWDWESSSLGFWGDGEEKWELTTYETAAAYTAAVCLDETAVGVLRFMGDRKTVKEIKEVFDRVYASQLHLIRLGSMDDLYETVQKAFNKDPTDAMNWAPKCFAYWCTNGKAYLGEKLDNHRYPEVDAVDLESFLKGCRVEDLHRADQMLSQQ